MQNLSLFQICLAISYYFYKRYVNIKFNQQIKHNDVTDIDEILTIHRDSVENEIYQFIQ